MHFFSMHSLYRPSCLLLSMPIILLSLLSWSSLVSPNCQSQEQSSPYLLWWCPGILLFLTTPDACSFNLLCWLFFIILLSLARWSTSLLKSISLSSSLTLNSTYPNSNLPSLPNQVPFSTVPNMSIIFSKSLGLRIIF